MDSGYFYTNTYVASRVLKNYSQTSSASGVDDILENYNNEKFTTKLPAVVYTSIMMFLGLPGNIIVFYIYFFKWQRSTSRIFILFLAALDTLNCSTTLPMEIYIMRNSVRLDQPLLCKVSRYSTYVMNCSSALILVGIAADRFKRICRPYQRAFSENQSKYISVAAILFSMATTWPSLILYGTRTVNLGNVTGSACLLENRYDTSPYPLAYFAFMISTTMIAFVVIIVLYYLVGLQMYKHTKFKLKNCTHVQKILDDKSITVKPEKSNGEKLKSSNNDLNNGEKKTFDNEDKVEILVNEVSVIQNEDNEHELKPYQLGLPSPCKEIGTSCGQNGSDLNLSDITQETTEQSINDLKVEEVLSQKKQSSRRKNQMVKEKKGRVRHVLEHGFTTINAPGRAKCVSCITVRLGRSTLMLCLITIAYVISFLPFCTLVIIRQTDSSLISRMSESGLAAYHLFLRSYILSSAVNPFIYAFCNAQFRKYCRETFIRNCFRRQQTYINHSSLFGLKG